MPLNFPAVEDIPLKKAPLKEVICQVRFPTLLRIAGGPPAQFQEHIRERFPVLEVERGVVVEVDGARTAATLDLAPAVYRFFDEDKVRSVALAPDFYALSTTGYRHWDEFADDLRYATEAVRAEYDIPYATRIGLRYTNEIGQAFCDTDPPDCLYELVRPELTVMLRTDAILSPDQAMQRIHATSGDGQLAFSHGLNQQGDPPQFVFILDFDHYIQGKVGLDDLLARCDTYHEVIYRAFRWCIAEGKLGAFEPVACR